MDAKSAKKAILDHLQFCMVVHLYIHHFKKQSPELFRKLIDLSRDKWRKMHDQNIEDLGGFFGKVMKDHTEKMSAECEEFYNELVAGVVQMEREMGDDY